MIIGAHLHAAAPHHAAGAEWTIQDTFTWLAARGHDCRVLSDTGPTRERIDDVLVYSNPADDVLAQHYQECDVMFAQLDSVMGAQILGATYQTPIIPWIHSHSQIETLGVSPSACPLLIFNAEHVASAQAWWPGESIIVHPPVNAARVQSAQPPRGACPTMVNLSHNKGGMTLYELAKMMQGHRFLGVMGVYGDQVMTRDGIPGAPPENRPTPLPVNLTIMLPQPRIADVLTFARTILLLSASESYGRVAQEAALNGIPTIGTPTAGLVECMGSAAQYVERDSRTAIQKKILRSYEAEWDDWSAAARERAAANQALSEQELIGMEKALRRVHRESRVVTL